MGDDTGCNMVRDAETTPLRTVSPVPRQGASRDRDSRSDRSGTRPSALDTPPDSEDAPIVRDHEESRDGADMLRAFLASAEGSEARALLEQSVKRALQRGLEGASNTTSPPLPPDLADTVRRWGMVLALSLSVAAPIVQQVAALLADFARPNQVVVDQLAEIRAAQVNADTRAADQEQLLRDSIAWMIDANRSLAEATGAPLPRVPAGLNLAKAQAEAAQDQ